MTLQSLKGNQTNDQWITRLALVSMCWTSQLIIHYKEKAELSRDLLHNRTAGLYPGKSHIGLINAKMTLTRTL